MRELFSPFSPITLESVLECVGWGLEIFTNPFRLEQRRILFTDCKNSLWNSQPPDVVTAVDSDSLHESM